MQGFPACAGDIPWLDRFLSPDGNRIADIEEIISKRVL